MSEYSSPKIWGPHFWYMLRCIANNYPLNPTKEDAIHVRNYFNELQYILPCEICKYTFRQHFNRHPIEKGLYNKYTLIDWVETIYQETKKVIQDKRIKILDPEEDIERIEPIKPQLKQSPSFSIKPLKPIEEQLIELRNDVMNKDGNLNFNKDIEKINISNNGIVMQLDNESIKSKKESKKESKKALKHENHKKTSKYNNDDMISVYSHKKLVSDNIKSRSGEKNSLDKVVKEIVKDTIVIKDNRTNYVKNNKQNIINRSINYINAPRNNSINKYVNSYNIPNNNRNNRGGLSVKKRCKCED